MCIQSINLCWFGVVNTNTTRWDWLCPWDPIFILPWFLLHLFIYVFMWGWGAPCHACGSQRTTYRSQLFSSTMWILGDQTQVNRRGHRYLLPTELSFRPFPWFKICELNTHCKKCAALIQIKLHFLLSQSSQKRARETQIPPGQWAETSTLQSVVGTTSSPRLLPLSQQSWWLRSH